jgi:hypothetical protein
VTISKSRWVAVTPGGGVRFRGINSTATAYAATTNIAFASRIDAISGWNATSNHFVIPVDGWYRITFAFKWGLSGTGPAGLIVVGGTAAVVGPLPYQAAFSGGLLVWEADLTAGDTVSAQVTGAMTTTSDSPAENNYLIIAQAK